MDRISDEFLEYKIAVTKQAGYCEAISINSDVLLPILQELKERRVADNKKLDIKAQLRLVRDKCPDVWKNRSYNQHCPDSSGLPSRKVHDEIGDMDKCKPCRDCDACMNEVLAGDK